MHAWMVAWEAAMAEVGYPRARLHPVLEEDGWSYGWMTDVDAYTDGKPDDPDAWATAHLAFILVDSLRPEWVRPSIVLQGMLDQLS